MLQDCLLQLRLAFRSESGIHLCHQLLACLLPAAGVAVVDQLVRAAALPDGMVEV